MVQKLPLGGTAVGKVHIARNVLYHQAALQNILRLLDVGNHAPRCFFGVGQRVQVVQHGFA